MRLKEKTNTLLAVQAGYLNVQAAEGQLIAAPNRKKTVATSGPTKLASQGMEVDFSGQSKYPYQFTAVISNMNSGAAGEGNFSL